MVTLNVEVEMEDKKVEVEFEIEPMEVAEDLDKYVLKDLKKFKELAKMLMEQGYLEVEEDYETLPMEKLSEFIEKNANDLFERINGFELEIVNKYYEDIIDQAVEVYN